MRSRVLSVFVLSSFLMLLTDSLLADDAKPGKTGAKEETAKKKPAKKDSGKLEDLVSLTRFYDHKINQHLYTYSEDEADKWREIPDVKEHQIIGDISLVSLPGTVPLWRAVRIEGKSARHFYYLKSNGVLKNTFIDAPAFKAYVWTKPGDGRIPIYCTTWTDNSDAFFDPSLEIVRTNRSDTKKSTGVQRPGLGGRDVSVAVFYVYPHSEPEAAEVKSSKESPETPEPAKKP
jgi:hypothetical protein